MAKKKKDSKFVSTGSTLLNLACTDHPFHGFQKGKYYCVIGDSGSGKTFHVLTCFAEASINPAFNNYRLIYDNAEDGALMDMKKYFGSGVVSRLEAPATVKGEPYYSSTIEEFYYHVDDAINEGDPFIYILDSMDALSSVEEESKFNEQKQATRKSRKITGSYTDGKAKKNSGNLRRVRNKIQKNGSILIIITQTRDNMGFGFEKKTRSGGTSLTFYATLEFWTSVVGSIKKTVKKKPRKLGIITRIKIKKNRHTGKERVVDVPMYYSFGIDDLGSCIKYLIDEGNWKNTKGTIKTKDFDDFVGTEEELIEYIEENNKERQLRRLVGKTWNEIESACNIKRKPRYN